MKSFCLYIPHQCSARAETHLSLPGLGGVSGKGDASDEDDDNEFFDAMEDPAEFITVPADPKYHRLHLSFMFSYKYQHCFVLFLLLRFPFVLKLEFLLFRRSGSNVSGFSSETGLDDQSVNVRSLLSLPTYVLICDTAVVYPPDIDLLLSL